MICIQKIVLFVVCCRLSLFDDDLVICRWSLFVTCRRLSFVIVCCFCLPLFVVCHYLSFVVVCHLSLFVFVCRCLLNLVHKEDVKKIKNICPSYVHH